MAFISSARSRVSPAGVTVPSEEPGPSERTFIFAEQWPATWRWRQSDYLSHFSDGLTKVCTTKKIAAHKAQGNMRVQKLVVPAAMTDIITAGFQLTNGYALVAPLHAHARQPKSHA
jgi:hypothetical protein